MKICMILGHFYPHVGGVEKLFMELAAGLVRQGHEVRVVCCDACGEKGRREHDGYTIFYRRWPLLFGHPLPRVKDLEEHVRWCDVVHTTTFTPALPARRAAKRLGKPVCITVHEALGEKWRWIEPNPVKAFLFCAFERYVITRGYDYWMADSLATQRDMAKMGVAGRVARVYPSVQPIPADDGLRRGGDLRDYFGLRPGEKTFLYYGRPGQPKGIFVYLDAIRLLVEKHGKEALARHRFCFVMSNDPLAQKKKFLRLVREYGLTDWVIVRDPVSREKLSALIAQADTVVVPSMTEGFGFSAVEACALGTPLLHSDGGSLPEVVYGRCLPFRNRDSRDLSEKLYEVISGAAHFVRVPPKSFPAPAMVEGVEEVYRRMSEAE